jgi:hypothetical protein
MITSFTEYIQLLDHEEHPASRRAVIEPVSEDVLSRTIVERPDLKKSVILNKFVPTNLLVILVSDQDEDVRALVASKRKLPLAHLQTLAQDSADFVRRTVVNHPKITREILEVLTQDEERDIAETARQRLNEHQFID